MRSDDPKPRARLATWLRARFRRRQVVRVPESNPALMILRELVEEVEGADYRDRTGNRLELRKPFRDARDLVYGYPLRRSRKVSS